MSSALKPVLTSGGSQNQPVSPQVNKPMHPPSSPATYGQPTAYSPHNATHPSPINAHSSSTHHSAHQNHYSLNVPTTQQHFGSGNTAPAVPCNHPVASAGQGQFNKSPLPTGGYQPNLGHPPHVVPPASQSLPATNQGPEKLQANGTPEVKMLKVEQNHLEKQDKPQPSPVPALERAHLSPEKPVVNVSPAVPAEMKPSKDGESSSATVASDSAANPPTVPAAVPSIVISVAPAVASNREAKMSPVTPATPVEEPPKAEESAANPPASESPKSKEPTPSPKQSPSKASCTPRFASKRTKTKDEESPKNSKVDVKPVSKAGASSGKRIRTQTQPYQSPIPEIELISKMSNWVDKSSKNNDEKLIVFYKNEFLAVRNSEGGFYVCQAVQNIYKSSPKIRIRWLSQDKADKTGEIYTPDFYDFTDFDCILTNLNLVRVDKGKFKLPTNEKVRTDSILKRAIAVEQGDATPPSLTEEHPDGLDLSLYKEESQLKKRKGRKRKAEGSKQGPKPKVSKRTPQKVQKSVKPTPTPATKKRTVAARKSTALEVKRAAGAASRAERAAKRRGADTTTAPKSSPVVDQKKAKVLAKVARKAVGKNQPAKAKGAKAKGAAAAPVVKAKRGAVKVEPSGKKSKRPSRK